MIKLELLFHNEHDKEPKRKTRKRKQHRLLPLDVQDRRDQHPSQKPMKKLHAVNRLIPREKPYDPNQIAADGRIGCSFIDTKVTHRQTVGDHRRDDYCH